MRGGVAAVAASWLVVTASAGIARADIVSLPAMGFVRYDPTGTSQDPTPDNGTLSPVVGTDLFAGVDFPVNGNSICRLMLIYGDTNPSESISATLYRKRIVLGGPVDAAPDALATVTSVGTVSGMRAKVSNAVTFRRIDEVNYFYYVKVTAQNFNTPLVGVQIIHKPACP